MRNARARMYAVYVYPVCCNVADRLIGGRLFRQCDDVSAKIARQAARVTCE